MMETVGKADKMMYILTHYVYKSRKAENKKYM